MQVRSLACLKLNQLASWLTDRIKVTADESWKAHYMYVHWQIRKFNENPDDYKADVLLIPPPGPPIGHEDWEFCGQF